MATKKFAEVKTSDLVNLDEKYELDKESYVKIQDLVDKEIIIYDFQIFKWKEKTGKERESIKIVFKYHDSDNLFLGLMHDSDVLKKQLSGCTIEEGDTIVATVKNRTSGAGRPYYFLE